MNPTNGNEYLRSAVLTATPEQLHLMLYDGAIRFANQAREALKANDIEQTHNALSRTQRIVVEMQSSLRPEVDPELCERVGSLYDFIYRRLVEANVNKDAGALDEALDVLKHLRQTWVMLIEKLQQERAAEVSAGSADTPDSAHPQSAGPDYTPGEFVAEG